MHQRLRVLGASAAALPSAPSAGPPAAVVFPRGDHALLLGTQNLVVVRGDADTLQKAQAAVERARPGRLSPDVRAARDAVLAPPATPAFHVDTPLVTQLNVGNTTRCNMACTYCYQELPGREEGGKARALDMDQDTARAMVLSLLEHGSRAGSVVLVFIGGESLLQRDLIKDLLPWARARGAERDCDVECVLYTNGALMDRDIVTWADAHGVSLVVSLDGPPRQHDEHRVFLSGRGTSRVVLRNIRAFMEHARQPLRRVRSVSTAPGQLLPLHRYLLDLGFNELYVQAAYGEDGYAGSNEHTDVEALADWYRGLLMDGMIIGIHPFTAILERLHRRGAAVTSWHPCNAGVGSLGVDANGDLYPCHHFYGETEHRLGSARDGIPALNGRAHIFAPVTQREPCSGCWNQRLCGGECYHRALTMDRGYFGTVTESCAQKKAFSVAALDLFTFIREHRPEVIGALLRREYSLPVPRWDAYDVEDISAYGA